MLGFEGFRFGALEPSRGRKAQGRAAKSFMATQVSPHSCVSKKAFMPGL